MKLDIECKQKIRVYAHVNKNRNNFQHDNNNKIK